MYETNFVGQSRAVDLISRINAEIRVGESLSPDTVALYTRKIKQVASRMTADNKNAITPEILVRDLAMRIQDAVITRVTARVEKSAALFWIAEQAQLMMDSGSPEVARYENAYFDIQNLSTKELPKNSNKTSSQKLRAFPDEALAILEKTALTDRSIPLLHALLFVRANLRVGLRPVEWFDAEIANYHHCDAFGAPIMNTDGTRKITRSLNVLNAKQSSIRGNGDQRTILLERLDELGVSSLVKWMNIVSELRSESLLRLNEASITRKVYGSMQRAIRRVLLAAGWQGKIPTIYSTRHQAVANAKADNLSQREIAALFGHSSTDTARRHYGKKMAGYSGRSLSPSPESILAVRSMPLRMSDIAHDAAPYASGHLIDN